MKRMKSQMSRIPRIIKLLRRWHKWRNFSVASLHSPLCIENDVVDTSRARNDLINAHRVDFLMFKVDRIINRLEESQKKAVYVVYGQKTLTGLVVASTQLGISRRALINHLCDADRSICEALEEIFNKGENR
mgnify:CR=1 FL=1